MMVSNRFFRSILLSAASLLLLANAASLEKENEVKAILEQMESEVLAFRDEMERVYSARCDPSMLRECTRNNYNDCSSVYPNQRCMEADELVLSTCGDGTSCNGLWDTTRSAVRIPANLATAPTDNPDVTESVCFSRLAEDYMVNKFSAGNQMYFGSATGTFRIIPARHSEVCGEYDPRRRPWFVAASSGPKDVVLLIDISGSMDDGRRIILAKEAAITIIDTLTVADRFAIVLFSDEASLLGEESGLIRATAGNKQLMIEAINSLEPKGGTNFYDAFDTAFNAIDETIRNERTSGCNVAVLFLTDGVITVGPGVVGGSAEDEVINLVNERTNSIATIHNRTTTIFTFSLGYQADHEVAKSIACSTNGVWTKVDDFSDDLVTAMSSYYKLYALGLGEGGNEEFTAWVEPYEFHTAGKVGTSVSAPVYDRSVNPPLFLGAVALDTYMDTIEEILGEDATSSTMLDRFVYRSTALCPNIHLAKQELDALRYLGGGEDAICDESYIPDNYEGIVPEKCPLLNDLPNNLWNNTAMDGKEYIDRACCEIGGTTPSDMCPITSATDNIGNSKPEEPTVTIDTSSGPIVTSSEPIVTVSSVSESSSGGSGTNSIVIILAVCLSVAVVGFAVSLLIFFARRRRSNPNVKNGSTNAGPEASGGNGGSDANNQTEVDVEMLLHQDSSIKRDMSAVAPPEAAPSAPPATNPAFTSAN